jgi:uncharacterized protein (DUF1778 family)
MASKGPKPGKTGKPQRDQIINIRVTPEQKTRFAKAAEEAGMDTSTFMRVATIEKIERTELAKRPGVFG